MAQDFETSPHPVGSHPFKFAGIFVFLIKKGIVVDFLFRKVDAIDFLKGRSVFLGICLYKAFCVFLNPCGERLDVV